MPHHAFCAGRVRYRCRARVWLLRGSFPHPFLLQQIVNIPLMCFANHRAVRAFFSSNDFSVKFWQCHAGRRIRLSTTLLASREGFRLERLSGSIFCGERGFAHPTQPSSYNTVNAIALVLAISRVPTTWGAFSCCPCNTSRFNQ